MHIYIASKRKKKERKKENSTCAQRRLRVWSEFSLSAWRKLGSLPTHWAHIEDYDLTRRMPRLIWVFAGRKDHFVGLVMRRLITLNVHLLSNWNARVEKKKCRCVDIYIVKYPLNILMQLSRSINLAAPIINFPSLKRQPTHKKQAPPPPWPSPPHQPIVVHQTFATEPLALNKVIIVMSVEPKLEDLKTHKSLIHTTATWRWLSYRSAGNIDQVRPTSLLRRDFNDMSHRSPN